MRLETQNHLNFSGIDKLAWHKRFSGLIQRNIRFIFHGVYAVLLAFFFVYGCFFILQSELMQTILRKGWSLGNLMLFLWLYIAVIAAIFWFYKYYTSWKDKTLICTIFLLALVPRLILALEIDWQPVSDFTNYYYMGLHYLNGSYDAIAQIVQGYTIPSFAGLAVLNGTLMRFFPSTILGTRVISSLLASLIVIPIFLLGRRYDRRVGIIAGFAFAIYPSNIIFSQVNTNQHGAILCVLFSINILLHVLQDEKLSTYKTILYSIGAGILMVFSYYFHPSWYTHLIAIGIFLVVLLVESWRNAYLRKKIIVLFSSFILCIWILNLFFTQVMLNEGLLYSADEVFWGSKLYVGFNPETYGGYSADDYGKILALPSEQRNKAAIQGALERIDKIGNIPAFWGEKIKRMWFLPDESFFWYKSGLETALTQSAGENMFYEIKAKKVAAIKESVDALSWFDYLYCLAIYILAAFGMIFRIKDLRVKQMDLLMLVLLGWISVHLFIEIQTRYRYFGMTIIMVFTAIGILTVGEYIQKAKRLLMNHKKKSSG